MLRKIDDNIVSVPCVFIHSKSPGRLLPVFKLCMFSFVIVRMLVCAGASAWCVCVCVCVSVCLCVPSKDKILRFKNTFIIIIINYYYNREKKEN